MDVEEIERRIVRGSVVEVALRDAGNYVMICEQGSASTRLLSVSVVGVNKADVHRVLVAVPPDMEIVCWSTQMPLPGTMPVCVSYGGRDLSEEELNGGPPPAVQDVWWITVDGVRRVVSSPVDTKADEAPTPAPFCSNCGNPNEWGMINGPDGSFTCYLCKQDPITRRRK
jgi:hypothetical protein